MDAVIVNGGLGPTVNDLSQEVAAQAAGVELALSEEWLGRMEELFHRRSRAMPPNNRKQALLPAGAELLDNPIGTACGFALGISRDCPWSSASTSRRREVVRHSPCRSTS